ncbi:hypothetical protein CN345_29870 [Bacillus thuringiensis]|uniref:hypothetical protein n=1 Tax=Bacillus thuringiensis TaxID=1428 RepID=UPI000BF4823E|nr:hypothetical protein [Bacillus thuringiensis]PEZ19476.1 hypothetical protein CN345_29870 [Bacillus thuringiensis]PGY39678.1 hypothetical protein COE09_27065 [Bacillus thuringiensis]
MHQLTIPEFFVLLSIDENSQTIEMSLQSNMKTYTCINIVLELYAKNYIQIDHNFVIHCKKFVSSISYIQAALDLTQNSDENSNLNMWLIEINKCSKVLYDSVLSRLSYHRKLKIIERRILGIMFQKKYQCFQNRSALLDFLRKKAMTDKSCYLSVVSLLYVMKWKGLLIKEVDECIMHLEKQEIYQLDLQELKGVVREIIKCSRVNEIRQYF